MSGAYASLAEKVLSKAPVFVIGSGVSLGAGIPGMGALARWLVAKVAPVPEDRDAWQSIAEKLQAGVGLEDALLEAGLNVSEALRGQIVKQTWSCIRSGEFDPLLKVVLGKDPSGIVALLNKYETTTQSVIHVVTTNYDHMIEWSAAAAGWPIWDGFDRDLIAKPLALDGWQEQVCRLVGYGRNRKQKEAKHLRLYKVHGSLSWFSHRSGRVLKIQGVHESELDRLSEHHFTPAIVTPGNDKYLGTHSAPFNARISDMRDAIDHARAMVFVGFGFNDRHLQGWLAPKLLDPDVPKLILVKEISPSLARLLSTEQIRGYVAVAEHDNDASVLSGDLMNSEVLPASMWTLHGLMKVAWSAP